MKIIILLIAFILCNLSFSCEILPNGNYIPCDIKEIIVEYEFKRLGCDKALIEIEIENIKTNIEYNVKLAESRLNEAEVKYIESIKKYKTARHNAASKSFIKSLIKQKTNAYIAKQKAYPDIVTLKAHYETSARQEAYSEMLIAEQKAHSEMIIAKFEYNNARYECGRIYAIAKGESTYIQVGKSPFEILKLIWEAD